MPNNHIYLFGEFRLDCASLTLTRADEEIKLQPRVFDTLVYLVEHAGTMVTKEDLIREVWAAAEVQDSALMRCVSLVRTALDDVEGTDYIRTVPGYGYVFCAQVKILSADDDKLIAAGITPSKQPIVPPSARKHFSYWWVVAAALSVLLVVVIANSPREPLPAFKATQLTTNSKELPILTATISPDGQFLAYADPSGIYIRQLDTNSTRTLRVPEEAIPTSLNWFPDQTHLLVGGYNTQTRKTMLWDVTTHGESKVLIQDLNMASLSRDGRRIGYIHNRNQLWLANSDGSEARLFYELPVNEQFDSVQFSFDGQRLIYLRITAEQPTGVIEVRNINGNITKQLYAPDNFIYAFDLLNDNELFVSQVKLSDTGTSELVTFKVNLADGTHSTSRFVATWPEHQLINISASDDGNNIIVLRTHGERDINVADLNTTGTAISNLQLLTHDNNIARPTGWLADNRTILFFSNRNGNYGIYQQHIDDVAPTPLVMGQDNAIRAVASADQKWLFYFTATDTAPTPGMRMALKRKPLAGGEAETIDIKDDGYRRLRCASHSNNCVLAEHSPSEAIFYAFDPEHGQSSEIGRIAWTPWSTNNDWDISSDGMRIAYIDHQAGPNQIGIITMGKKATTIKLSVTTNDPLRTLNWDATGSGFYISTHDDAGTALRLLHVGLDGTIHELQLILGAFDGWAIPSPDGKHLAIEHTRIGGNAWLLRRQ